MSDPINLPSLQELLNDANKNTDYSLHAFADAYMVVKDSLSEGGVLPEREAVRRSFNQIRALAEMGSSRQKSLAAEALHRNEHPNAGEEASAKKYSGRSETLRILEEQLKDQLPVVLENKSRFLKGSTNVTALV